MTVERTNWRRCFELASSALVDVVASISPIEYEAHGLGVWTVRDLVGHASRAMLTIETYLQTPAASHEIDDPVTYYLMRFDAPSNADAVAARGREAGAALGDNPAAAVSQLATRARQLVNSTGDEISLASPSISFGAYLATRVFELTVHCLDLLVALDREQPEALRDPVAACLELAAAIAGRTNSSAAVLLALTGRRGLPESYSVV